MKGVSALGLCSVTLRERSIAEVVSTAQAAGLTGIEWGTDIHVADAAAADEVQRLSSSAGLAVLSLGSYYRSGSFGDFSGVMEAAILTGAPRIRIWAGTQEPDQADSLAWTAVVDDTRRIAQLSAENGLELAFEYHSGTLTSDAASTLQLLERIGMDNVGTYWQPSVGLADEEVLESLHQLLDHVRGVHCFSWWPRQERLPLDARANLWSDAAKLIANRGIDMMLEFVQEDSPENVIRDARTLQSLTRGKCATTKRHWQYENESVRHVPTNARDSPRGRSSHASAET